MIDALHIATTGLRAQQQQIDVISNNVANLQTPGFKRARVNFAEVAWRTDPTPAGHGAPLVGGGARIATTLPDFTLGEVRMTRNPLDLAIDGRGLLELVDAQGAQFYTRAGQLRLDSEGFLATPGGLRLAQGIQVPPDVVELTIGSDGEVRALFAGETEKTVLGVIELVDFPAPDALLPVGDNLYARSEGAGEPIQARAGEAGTGRLRQGFLEMANVDLIDEMSALVMAQRAYQLNARLLQASDQVLETINNLRR